MRRSTARVSIVPLLDVVTWRKRTSSMAYVSSLSMTRILHVSENSIICVSSTSMMFSIGSDILTLSPSLWLRKITRWRLLTHSFALGALSALKLYVRWLVTTSKLTPSLSLSVTLADMPNLRSIWPCGKYKLVESR